MSKTCTYNGKEWNVAAGNDGAFVLSIINPREGAAGRTLLVTPAGGVWECTRDGAAKPLAVIDTNNGLHERLSAAG